MKTLSQDIYQDCGFECSAAILQVASQNPLPAGRGMRIIDDLTTVQNTAK